MADKREDAGESPYNEDQAIVNRWIKEIELAEKTQRQQAFVATADRILRKYINKADEATIGTDHWAPNIMYNVLWSNVQVLEPALYSRMPKPVVERTFKDADPIGRLASEIAERAIRFNLLRQQDKFNYAMSAVVQDRLLGGRGTAKVCYSADFEAIEDDEGESIQEEGGPPAAPKPNTERVELEYVHWTDYLESTARTQYEVRWRKVTMYLTRAECIQEFGEEVGKAIALGTGQPKKRKTNQDDEQEFMKQAQIHVIEDKASKKIFWISPGYPQAPLKILEDPYKLLDFWSFPLPLVATTTTDSTIPVADYVLYQGLADEYNYVANRLRKIVNCIRLVGAVAKQFAQKLDNITKKNDGDLVPMDAWSSFVEGRGFAGLIDWVPFQQCAAAIQPLMEYQQSLKAQIDEITSMPDIVRGSSDPNDPVYTQQQKAHWTVIKLVKKQQDVQRFCREVISKMGQMIFEPGFFNDETIWLMAGVGQMDQEKQSLFPQALALLRDDRLNTFRIDIETDSTIAIDQADQAGRWFEYANAMKQIVSDIQGVAQISPAAVAPLMETALQTARMLGTGRSVEGAWERALDQWEQQLKQAAENPAPEPPNPDILKAQTDQMKAQIEGQKAQSQFQLDMQEQQFNQWLEQQKLSLEGFKVQGDLQVKTDANQIAAGQQMDRAQVDRLVMQLEAFEKQFKAAVEGEYLKLDQQKLQFERDSRGLEMTEKFMEEKRLNRQDNIELAKLAHQERLTDKKIQAAKNAPA